MKIKDSLLSATQGRQVVSNIKAEFRRNSATYSKSKRHNVGILEEAHELFSRIDDLVEVYGAAIVGTALEQKRQQMDLTQPWLYYDSSDSALGIQYDEGQEEWVKDFLFDLELVCSEIEKELEDDVRKEDEESKSKEEKAEGVEEAYKRERRNLKRLINRRRKRGLNVDIDIPDKPKKVTQASVRRLQRLSERIKTTYKYLGGGRYRRGN